MGLLFEVSCTLSGSCNVQVGYRQPSYMHLYMCCKGVLGLQGQSGGICFGVSCIYRIWTEKLLTRTFYIAIIDTFEHDATGALVSHQVNS